MIYVIHKCFNDVLTILINETNIILIKDLNLVYYKLMST